MIDPAQLTRDLGGKWHGHYGTAPCPICQTERRKDQNALGIRTDGDRLLMNCKKSGCDFKDILIASGIQPGHVEVDLMALENARRERLEREAKTMRRAQSMWDQGRPIEGTKGEAYLRGRGITCALPPSLRWLPDCYHKPTGRFVSAMVARVSTGAIHRTFFTKQGVRLDKAIDTKDHKMSYGTIKGGHVVLSEAVGPLVVCEGVETGLSLASGLLSGPATVWAALSTSGMKGLNLPARPGELIVGIDNGAPGETAGNGLATRASALGWTVSILAPPSEFGDWNDVLVGKGVAA